MIGDALGATHVAFWKGLLLFCQCPFPYSMHSGVLANLFVLPQNNNADFPCFYAS